MVPLISGRLFAVLDRLLRAPLQAGEALLAFVVPYRSALGEGDIFGRAYLRADFT